jgi:hypothetical protein
MPRSLFAGSTDYSHQALGDIIEDLQSWLSSLKQVDGFLESAETKLRGNTYVKDVDPNVLAILAYARKFYSTSISELTEILFGMEQEVENHHVTRLKSLGQTAAKLNNKLGVTWHEERRPWKAHGDPSFALVERMYGEARDMATDMVDLENLAMRLADFVGKRGVQSGSYQEGPAPNMQLMAWYVDLGRISDLQKITSRRFDLTRLVELCKELNTCSAAEAFLAVIILVRAILDHVPPIFGCKTFAEVANNYNGTGKSFKDSMEHLEKSSRKIADAYLHEQIRQKEALPNKTQVNFSNDLDVLLAEIVRILK